MKAQPDRTPPGAREATERVVASAVAAPDRDAVASRDSRLGKIAARAFHRAMFPYLALAEDQPWQPGPYPGVELKILHRHELTGGVVVLRKFHAGQTIPAHIHPLANEWAWILSGEWLESGESYTPGTLFHAPKGELHGPHEARTEVISLTIFDGPLTVA